MGSGPSLPLAVGDSIVSPGNPSVVSDPIEHDYNAFCEELMRLMKYPVPQRMEPALKACVVTEGATPDDFEVKAVLDPVKLQAFGFANSNDPSLERIECFQKISLDRKGRFLTCDSYEGYWAGEEPKLLFKARADFTSDPFRIDYFWTLPDGTRQATDLTLGALKICTDKIMSALADRKVTLQIDEAKTCVTSGPIDEAVTTYEPLFDALIATTKATPGATVEDIDDTAFKVCGEDKAQPYMVVVPDKDQGTVVFNIMSPDGMTKMEFTTWTFTKSPLSVEIRLDRNGDKTVGKSTHFELQRSMDVVIGKATNTGWGLGIF